LDCDPAGFEWLDANDSRGSTVSFFRKGQASAEAMLIVCNFTPIPRDNYRAGVPAGGSWQEVLNTNAAAYGGSGTGNLGFVRAAPRPCQGRPFSVNLTLPPLSAVYLKGPAGA